MLKIAIKFIIITAVITFVAISTVGILAPKIAIVLVGSNFAGLSGAALTSASLAYLGGSAILGLGVGTGVSGGLGYMEISEKKEYDLTIC